MTRRASLLLALFAAAAAIAAEQRPPGRPHPAAQHAAEADLALVAVCDRAAAVRPLSGGDVALCSAAYERLVAAHGGYAAYAAARLREAPAER